MSRVLREPARWQQLAVRARFADGQVRDVTRLTVFSSSDANVADVTNSGLVEFQQSGEVDILCRYLDEMVAVRLTDVSPDGTSALVSFGILNLAHRDTHEHPSPLRPGQFYDVAVTLKPIAQVVPKGHRLRVAISSSSSSRGMSAIGMFSTWATATLAI